MIKYQSSKVVESNIAPGVQYTVDKISHRIRMELNSNSEVADLKFKVGELLREYNPVQEEIQRAEQVAKSEPCTCNHSSDIHDKDTGRCSHIGCSCREPHPDESTGGYDKYLKLMGDILDIKTNYLYPIYIKYLVPKISGLEIDGVPATASLFVDKMPSDLIYELGKEIDDMLSLSSDKLLGFESPLTGEGATMGGKTKGISAPSVSETNSINQETANVTSPS